MQNFPKYDTYKDSGISWLHEIPEHWELKKNKYLVKELKIAVGNKAHEYLLLSLTLNGVIARDMENMKGKFPAEFNTYKVVKTDDLIFCLFDIEETPRTIGIAKQDGMITGAYTIFRSGPEISPRYLYYYYLSLDFDKRLKPLYSGLRKVIQRDTFMSIKTPLPSIEEQDRIVNFLDQKTAEIDEAIAKKQRLIELLKEQKAILINQAVMKGIKPNVPMKDSGMEWIGEIPKHWSVIPSRYLFRDVTRMKRDGTEVKFSVTQKRGLVPTDEMEENSTQAVSYDSFKLCHPGDLVLNKYKAHLGVFWAADQRGIITNNYTVFGPQRVLNPKYFELLYHTNLYQWKFRISAYGIVEGMMPLYSKDFASVQSILPPIDEQNEIVNYAIKVDKEYNSVSEKIEDEIRKLIELKHTYISSAVTGKIKI